ncbi:MAG: PHP domain-containing protein [Phycisphaeraceae bacterium]
MVSARSCDLHLHSTASDGTDAPAALAALARDAGLSAFALTDHDTTAGLSDAAAAAEAIGIPFVPGIELSADPTLGGAAEARGTLHVLGYFVRHDDPQLQQLEEWLREARAQRNPRIIERLNELGVDIDNDEVEAVAGGQVVGRPHIAQVLVKKGYVRSVHEAFARYIGEGAVAHVRKDRLAAADAIAAIHHAGGLAALAHPVQLHLPDPEELEPIVARLVMLGLDGIETHHSDHTAADVKRFERIAKRHGLVTTGGSDYHGTRKATHLGEPRVPLAVYEALVEAHRQRMGV